jgi:endonuclease YncB( thermonuclease family)
MIRRALPQPAFPCIAALVVVIIALVAPPGRAAPDLADQAITTGSHPPAASPFAPRALAPFEIRRVLDGDTVEGVARVWPDHEVRTKVRLRGVDAPELNAPCEAARRRATAARDTLANLVRQGPLHLADIGRDKYGGRVVARVLLPDGTDLGERLKAAGHARAYAGGRRLPVC